MELVSIERPVGYHYLIVKVTRDGDIDLLDGVADDNSINDGQSSEVYIIKGHNTEFQEKIDLSRCMPNPRDQVFLATSGVFMLYEKYFTLDQLVFKTTDESGKPLEFTGERIAEELQRKNQNLSLYPAFLLIVLTKNLKMYYLNLDQYLLLK